MLFLATPDQVATLPAAPSQPGAVKTEPSTIVVKVRLSGETVSILVVATPVDFLKLYARGPTKSQLSLLTLSAELISNFDIIWYFTYS